jgi:hypothetical protein
MKVGASFVRERLRLGEGEWGGMVCEEGGRGRLGGGGLSGAVKREVYRNVCVAERS